MRFSDTRLFYSKDFIKNLQEKIKGDTLLMKFDKYKKIKEGKNSDTELIAHCGKKYKKLSTTNFRDREILSI